MRELGKENGMETEVSIRSIKGRESTYVCFVNDTLCFQDSSKVCLTQLQQLLTPPKSQSHGHRVESVHVSHSHSLIIYIKREIWRGENRP